MIDANGAAHWQADTGVALLTESVGDMLRRQARDFPDRPALFHLPDAASDDVVPVSYSELLALAENCARWLAKRVGPGDRVAAWSRNELETVVLQYACALSGAIIVHLNTAWTDAEVEHALAVIEPSLLFAGVDHRGRELRERLAPLAKDKAVHPLSDTLSPAQAPSPDTPLPAVQQDDPFLIQFTSGTTGKAKGALLNHRAALLGGWLRPHCEGATHEDVWLNAVPFHHVGGSIAIMLGALGVGGAFVVLRGFDREQLIRLMPVVGATRMGGVPTMWHDMLASPNLPESARLNSVSLGGASVPRELAQGIFDRLGARCGIAYGQSEFTIITAAMPDDPVDVVCNTVGRPLPHVEMKIIDTESGAVLAQGEPGEICVRGPMCMDGYWRNDEATAETIDSDGFLHTGDIGTLDADGYCQVRGRCRDVIIRGGENIYPAEIEGALMAHPDVAMAAVVGVDNARLGQEVGAAVVLHKGASVSAEELEAHVATAVASFKVPRHWRFVDAMPMTASGKVRKVELEQDFREP
jgi:fatty-acyl-CoA synthase